MRRALLLSSVLLTSGAIACASSSSEPLSEGSEQNLTLLDLECKAGTTRFDVSPAFGGVAIGGTLTAGAASTSFVCREPAADAAPAKPKRARAAAPGEETAAPAEEAAAAEPPAEETVDDAVAEATDTDVEAGETT